MSAERDYARRDFDAGRLRLWDRSGLPGGPEPSVDPTYHRAS